MSSLNIAHLALVAATGDIDFRYGDCIDWRKSRPALSSWVDEVSRRECFATTVPTDPPA